MKITSFYPVLACADVAAARQFYERLLGFTAIFASDWYVHLAHPGHDSVALALLAKDHETLPPKGRTPAAGVLVNFEVENVDGEYQRLVDAGAEVLIPLRDEAFGQRHFILQGPDGVMIDVITPIAASAEYASHYITP